MALYSANSTNARNFELHFGDRKLGELTYEKWYSFRAEINLADGTNYRLIPKGFMESTIELRGSGRKLLEFSMGWKGIHLRTSFSGKKMNYLLKPKGLIGSKYTMVDEENREVAGVLAEFKWRKFRFDFTIETSPALEQMEFKEVLLFTLIHCVNYYITTIAAMGSA